VILDLRFTITLVKRSPDERKKIWLILIRADLNKSLYGALVCSLAYQL
jgi:hypothetical protein